MVKESSRKCSYCGHNGHNSRTCTGKGCLKLFGVTILNESIRKSKSLGNLASSNGENSGVDAGYLSDGLVQSERAKEAHERKKGVSWTADEHRSFLVGLEKLGKGDWRGISKNYVPSRTPTQVASHAQKYFLRLAATDKKKRRSSLFDLSFKETGTSHSPPQEPPDKSGDISQQGDNSSAANSNNIIDTQGQGSASANAAILLETPPVLPLATNFGFPDFRQMPYLPMVGVSSNGQNFTGTKIFPTISFLPVVNFPNNGYFCLPKSYRDFAASTTPYMSQTSTSVLPQSLPHGPPRASPEGSMTKKDGLDLHIGVI